MLEGHFNCQGFKKKSELVEFSVVFLLRMSERDTNPNEAEGSSKKLRNSLSIFQGGARWQE